MKEKQEELLRFLLNQGGAVSSKILAEKLGVSVRTVKTYISQLNQLGKEPIIASSNLGYTVHQEAALALLQETDHDHELPQNFKDRAFYIVKKILIDHQDPNLFDLSEELFVSYSTLKADIGRMNKMFEKYHVKFVVKQDAIQLMGEEKEKRRLMSYIIFEEVPQKFLNHDILEKNFEAQDVAKLSEIIRSLMAESNYQLNDFSYINLMIHLLILLESVRNNKTLITRNWFSSWLTEDKAQLVTRMIERIEETFDITLNQHEREEIHMIFQANANYIPANNFEELAHIVGNDLVAPINQVLQDVHDTYGIFLGNESFVVPFSLHISGLYSRAKQETFLKNPMLEALKKDYPIVYEIAVYISLRLHELLGIAVSEDECAYIALHIGAELEHQKRNASKISTVLVCPKYMHLDEKLYEEIKHHFGNQLVIQSVYSDPLEIKEPHFDLMITTLAVPPSEDYAVIKVAPLFSNQQKMMMMEAISELQQMKKRSILKKNFNDFFHPQFFMTDASCQDREGLLHTMCQKLEDAGIVTHEFFLHVLEREEASSTAFSAIAIPHSVHMEAQQTMISIGIFKNGLTWGAGKVNVVLLAAINEVDRHRFTEIYEGLISLFDSPESYHEIKQVKSFEDFRNFIFMRT